MNSFNVPNIMNSIENKTNGNGEMAQVGVGLVSNNVDMAVGGSALNLKKPSEIKVENLKCGIEKEKKNSEDPTKCANCHSLQKKLNISRGWNRFFKEKLINIDKVLHIITEFENEKQKNLELQLAYDQRSREWTQQQEQLIGLLNEVQPLREKLKIAEEVAAEEKKLRLKHQYMDESSKVTIQQLQAKVTQMHSIANPLFVENLGKKLTICRSEKKKMKCNLEFNRIEIEEMRSYISQKHHQIEKLSKKFYWSLKLGDKYGKELLKDKDKEYECFIEWDVLQTRIEEATQSLRSQYDTFRSSQQQKFKEKHLELSCIPSFLKWVKDFENETVDEEKAEEGVAKKEPNGENKLHDAVHSDIESGANLLEKMISGTNEEEIFEKQKKHDGSKTKKRVMMPVSSRKVSPKGRRQRRINNQSDTEISCSQDVSDIREENLALSGPTRKKRLSKFEKTNGNSGGGGHRNTPSETKEDSCVMFNALLKKSLETPTKRKTSKTTKYSISPPSSSKSSPTKIQTPQKSLSEITRTTALDDHLFLSDTSSSEPESDKEDKTPKGKRIKKLKVEHRKDKDLRVSHGSKISEGRPREKAESEDSLSVIEEYEKEKRAEERDRKMIENIMKEMTVSPIGYFSPYSEECVFSSGAQPCVQMKKRGRPRKVKPEVIPKTSAKLVVTSFVPPRVTRFSKRLQSSSENILNFSSKEEKEKTEKEWLPRKKRKSRLFSDTEESNSSRESPLVCHLSSSLILSPGNRMTNAGLVSEKDIECSSKSQPETASSNDTFEENSIAALNQHLLLKSDLSVSSSNTDTEENEEADVAKIESKMECVGAEVEMNSSIFNDSDTGLVIDTTYGKTAKERKPLNNEDYNTNNQNSVPKSETYLKNVNEVERSSSPVDMPVLSADTPTEEIDSQYNSEETINKKSDISSVKSTEVNGLPRSAAGHSLKSRFGNFSNDKKETFDQIPLSESVIDIEEKFVPSESTSNSLEVKIPVKTKDSASPVKCKSKTLSLFQDESSLQISTSPINSVLNKSYSSSSIDSLMLSVSSCSEDDADELDKNKEVTSSRISSVSNLDQEDNRLIAKNDEYFKSGTQPGISDALVNFYFPLSEPVASCSIGEINKEQQSPIEEIKKERFATEEITKQEQFPTKEITPLNYYYSDKHDTKVSGERASSDLSSNIVSNQARNSSTQIPQPKSAWVPSFYKERNDESPVQESSQILEELFEDSTSSEENRNSEKKVQKSSTDGIEMEPRVRPYLFSEETAYRLEEEQLNAKVLEEFFQDIIGSHHGGQEWIHLIMKISKYVNNIVAPNTISKLQPLIRIVLISILRSSPYENRERNYPVPPTMYKLFQIVRILECHQNLPVFTLDSLVNVAAHKLVLTKHLRPNSLASMTTWFMASCFAQYNALTPPIDEERIHWCRSFLIDLLFHHKGLVHEAILAALNASKKMFIRIVKYRESTVVEQMVFWIAVHGHWIGPKATKTQLIENLKIKLGLHNPPEENPKDTLQSILVVLTAADTNPDKFAATKCGFLLLLKWLSASWTTTTLFPLLKTIYYDESQIRKVDLESLRQLLGTMVKEAGWAKDEEELFIKCLNIFPIVK